MRREERRWRYELKYYLHAHEFAAIRPLVGATFRLDAHSRGPDGYHVRSLYFDGPAESAFFDKLAGVGRRDKYRIRVYNGEERTLKLERKSRINDRVSKETAAISREEYERLRGGDYDWLAETDSPLLGRFYRLLVHAGFRPAIIVDYMREAYVWEEADVRITFDKRLAAAVNGFDLLDGRLAFVEVLPPPVVIMEIKYRTFLPEQVRALVQPAASVRSAISKYVLCRQQGVLHFHFGG